MSATRIALPIAVPRWSWKRSIAASTSSRLAVGYWTIEAAAANDTTPIRVLRGTAATKARAASWAATIRLGFTSVARMLPETSTARMMASFCVGTRITAAGRATASTIATSASRNRSGGRRRRQRAPPATGTMSPA